MPDTGPKTLIEAVRHFSDLDTCHAYMVKLKWPDGRLVLQLLWSNHRLYRRVRAAEEKSGYPEDSVGSRT